MTLQELQGLISANKTQEAIAIMAKAIGDKNTQLRDDLVMLSSQISRNETLFMRGLVKTDDYVMAGAQSIRAILAILEEVSLSGYLENLPSDNAEVDQNAPVFVEKRTKIQFLAANPIDTSKLELEREYIEIRKIFKPHQSEFVLVEAFDATLESFFEAIFQEKAQIVQFSGMAEENGLILNRKDGTCHPVSYEYLAATFKLFRNHVECVFINTMYSDVFAKVVSRFIPYAIGIKDMISDIEAITFAGGFYTALAFEKNYLKAFNQGKDLLIQTRMQSLNAEIPRSYGITNTTQTDAEKMDDLQKIPYVLFMNGIAADENDNTPDDFPLPLKDKKPTQK
jgi:Effector-associated domain 11